MSTEQAIHDFLNLVDLHLQAIEKTEKFPSSLTRAREKELRKAVKESISSARMVGIQLMRVKTKRKGAEKPYFNRQALGA